MWESLHKLQEHQISHGDLRDKEITVSNGAVFFGGFGSAEYGANDNQLQSDIAQLLVTTSALYGADAAVEAAICVLGKDTVLKASRRLTKTAVPKHIRDSVNDPKGVISRSRAAVMRQTGTEKIKSETITRFTRSQLIQLVLLVALVYVAYPFISTVPTFFNALGKANWWWALLGLAISASTYVGRGGSVVGVRRRIGELLAPDNRSGGQHFCRHHHPGRRRRAGAEHPDPAEERAQHHPRHHGGRAAAVDAGDHARAAADLLQHRGGRGN